jgi:enolase
MKIQSIQAREILDSRGNPTVSATVELLDGVIAEASVPSGASTGSNENTELRDNDTARFGGQGELKAVKNVNIEIAQALIGMDAADQASIDKKMIDLDGTKNKAKLGANAILAVSLATARAQAISSGVELFEYLSLVFSGKKKTNYTLPSPMFNILNGGKHADNNVDIQEIMVVPVGFPGFEEKLRAGSEIDHVLKTELSKAGLSTGLGDEGGFAPDLKDNESAIQEVASAIADSGYSPKKVRISLDIAASEVYDEKKSVYLLQKKTKSSGPDAFIKKISTWVKKYDLLSVEDGLWEKDMNWPKLKKAIAPAIAIGDDLFTTNPERISEGIDKNWAGGVIIKPNQIGTLTETLEAIRRAQAGNLSVIVSHRSGETDDSFIADLAVAVGAEYIKSGAPVRGERLAKYNRLTEIEDYIAENYS